MMKALLEVVDKAGGSMSEASRNAVLGLIDDDSSDRTGMTATLLVEQGVSDRYTDAMAMTNAKLLGALVKNLPAATAIPLIKYVLFLSQNREIILTATCRSRVLTTNFSHASILGLNALLVEAPKMLLENFTTETPSVICQGVSNSDVCD